jgi:hypothetical protein
MHDSRSALVLFGAAAIAIAIGVMTVIALHDRQRHRPERHAAPGRSAVAAAPSAARSAPGQHPRPASSARANAIARRFAAAWRAWDAGKRSPRVAAVLRRSSVAALWRRLQRQRDRPTAARPPGSLALQRVRAVAAGGGTWRAAIVARQPADSYLATLVIVATPAGPRVADLQH